MYLTKGEHCKTIWSICCSSELDEYNKVLSFENFNWPPSSFVWHDVPTGNHAARRRKPPVKCFTLTRYHNEIFFIDWNQYLTELNLPNISDFARAYTCPSWATPDHFSCKNTTPPTPHPRRIYVYMQGPLADIKFFVTINNARVCTVIVLI